MPLIDMTSDLTSIKYGRDRRGGGSSGQPYFTKDIPERLQSINFANSFLGSDFLIRGGVRSVTSVLEDEVRLSKWFSSFNSADGLLFIAKQNLLNRQRPKTGINEPQRLYTPLNTLGQAATNNLGIHLMKDGLLPVLDDEQTYLKKTEASNKNTTGLGDGNKNKLLLLYETNLITPTQSPDVTNYDITDGFMNVPGFGSVPLLINTAAATQYVEDSNLFAGFKSNLDTYGISLAKGQLLNYQGGPNASISGRSIVRKVFDTNEGFANNKDKKGLDPRVGQYLVYSPDLTIKKTQSESTGFGGTSIRNFEKDLVNKTIETGVSEKRRKELIGEPSNYTSFNRAKTFGEGNPGIKGRNRSAYYTTDVGESGPPTNISGSNTVFEYDAVNAQPLYSSLGTPSAEGVDDYIKFHIGVLNLDSTGDTKEFTWIHLRAALTSFNDNYNATWNEIKYMGRGNSFYKYGGFTRGITMGLDVIASSKYEQAFMYDKLNYLASVIGPNYSDVGYMRGNIIKLTVGDYLNDVYGILTGLSYSIPQESPWDIGRNNDGSLDSENSLQLPHYIQISNFGFTPIHSFMENSISPAYVNGTNSTTPNSYISMGAEQRGQQKTQKRRELANKQ
jgi:hypothetical protein